MISNPILGVFFHWLGGLASGSFYVPFKGVKKWAWEVYWLAGGFFSWIIAPWVVAFITTPDLITILTEQSGSTLFWTYFWGAMWGFGGLTFGLTMRYLGMSLGMAVALGLTALFGTYMPPIFDDTLVSKLHTIPGQIILIGMIVCLVGIMIAGAAGLSKEKEMSEEQKRASVREFNLKKGILIAIFSGIMSSCMSYALVAGTPIAESAVQHGADKMWSGFPKLIVVMAGGFTTNLIWCLYLLIKNKTMHEFFSKVTKNAEPVISTDPVSSKKVPLLANFFFSALAGTVWYFQYFFYTMGETQMGEYQFSSWTLHMASIIIFSSLWGIYLKEWNNTSGLTKFLLGLALFSLVGSTIILGYANLLGTQPGL